MSSIIPQLIINGLIAGAIYSLVASGFSLIYSVTRFMHFAHGATILVASYLIFTFTSLIGLNFILSIFLTLILTTFSGVLINYLVYKPLRKRKASSAILLISSLALLIFLNSLILIIFGPQIKSLKITWNKVFDFLSIRITLIQILIILTSLVFLIVLWLLIFKTRLGKALRAVSDNPEASSIMGINLEKINNYSFALGSFLAGLAGILIALEQNIWPEMGISLILKGFVGAIIGGITSIHGSIFGSLFLGLIENLGILYLPSGFKDGIAFALLIIFLLFRPQGIFGLKKRI